MAGIPRSEDGKLRRRILADAVELVATKGFDALTLRAIGELSGMSEQRVRYYFRNTAVLLFEVADGLFMDLLNSLKVPDDIPAGERLAQLCRCYAVAIAGRAARRLRHVPFLHLLPGHRSILQYKHRWLLQVFDNAVRDCCPSLDATRVTVLALSLLALLDSHTVWSCEPGAMVTPDYADLARRMVLSGSVRQV